VLSVPISALHAPVPILKLEIVPSWHERWRGRKPTLSVVHKLDSIPEMLDSTLGSSTRDVECERQRSQWCMPLISCWRSQIVVQPWREREVNVIRVRGRVYERCLIPVVFRSSGGQ
jgi:hypothetical protein